MGTCITPAIQLIQYAINNKSNLKLLYFCKNYQNCLLIEELNNISKFNQNIQVDVVYNEASTDYSLLSNI